MSTISELYALLEILYNKLTPNINGNNDTCWQIGLKQQVSEQLYYQIKQVLGKHEQSNNIEPNIS